MALTQKNYPIELVASCEEGRETELGLLVLRQTPEGKRKGEWLIQAWEWDDLIKGRLPQPLVEGAMDRCTLLNLAKACLVMAGLKPLARRIENAEEEE